MCAPARHGFNLKIYHVNAQVVLTGTSHSSRSNQQYGYYGLSPPTATWAKIGLVYRQLNYMQDVHVDKQVTSVSVLCYFISVFATRIAHNNDQDPYPVYITQCRSRAGSSNLSQLAARSNLCGGRSRAENNLVKSKERSENNSRLFMTYFFGVQT